MTPTTRKPKGKKRTIIRLTLDLYAFYSDLAYREDISLSAAINRALRAQMKKSGATVASPDDSLSRVN